jgi:cobalt transporter subunit CbtA
MFRNLFAAAVLAALCAGLVFSVVQQFRLTPLIFAAEGFEGSATDEPHTHEGEAAVAPHAHDASEWMPQDGIERTAYTLLANVLAAAGYALVIGAVAVIAGLPITFANGLLWGAGGFAAFMLAPSFGLPPGLPTMAIADTFARQVWWWGTALATGAALLLAAKQRAPWALAVAAALIAAPHLIGAPQPPDEPSPVPANLAASFTASVLFASAVMWAVLGLAFGWFSDRFLTRSAASANAAKGARA